jgi:dTDP-glucose pyrophosphorylase
MEIKEFLLDENKTVIEAMQRLDQVGKKILFITRDNQFVATLTDGDVRRFILKKGKLDSCVKLVANYHPMVLPEKASDNPKSFMKKNNIDALPLINEKGEIVSIIFLNDEIIRGKKRLEVPVVIMAGGLGTRLYPYTKILPKPLIPVGEIPIAEHIINRFNKYGCKDFYLILNHKKNMIKAYFNEISKDYSVNYIDEEKPLGTGGGLSLLKNKINSTFILSNCDILIEEDYYKLYRHHIKENNLITMVTSLKNLKIPYGVIEISETGEIESMEEKPSFSFFTNTGMYVVEPRVIEELEENKVIGFPDIIEHYQNKGEKVGVYPISEKSWLDMGQLDELEEMRKRIVDEEQ